MLRLFPEHIEQIRQEAIEGFPLECVWLITTKGLRQVKNVADDPSDFFSVAPADMAKARKEGLLAVVHSHVNERHYPSAADMSGQINNGVPWGIVLTDGTGATDIRWWGGTQPDQVEDLIDRTFCHGTTDCYSLVKDYYLVRLGIQLPDFPRAWEWWTDQNLLAEGFPQAGFSVVKDVPRPHDVWLASFNSPNSKLNHCGVLLEDELTHHHPGSGSPINSSKKAEITAIHRYLPYIHVWVRHKELA